MLRDQCRSTPISGIRAALRPIPYFRRVSCAIGLGPDLALAGIMIRWVRPVTMRLAKPARGNSHWQSRAYSTL